MNSTPSSPQPGHDVPDELILRHLPLTYRFAACSRRPGARYEDLVQSAELGLVRAAERFDPGCGLAFDAFAAPVIAGELSRSQPEPAEQVAEAEHRISGALVRASRVRDLAGCLGVEAEVVADGLLAAAHRETVTLNLPVERRNRRLVDRFHAVFVTPAAA